MITVNNLCVSYGNALVIKGLDIAFSKGKFTALVGPNGCGKSTLLKAIMGFLPPDEGRIELDGRLISKMPRRDLARRIAYLPQDCDCPDYVTLGELVEMGGYARYSQFGGPGSEDRDLFKQALTTVGLADMAHMQVNALSGGQKQRAWLAMILAQDAEIILLDEPVNHLDVKYQYAVLELVRDLTITHNKTVITVLHDLNLTSVFADEVVMMRDGNITTNGPTQDVMQPENIKQAFDIETDVFSRDDRLVCLPKHKAMT